MKKSKLSDEARAFFAAQGSKGGKAKGATKRRTTEQARKAGAEGARVRWAKKRKAKA